MSKLFYKLKSAKDYDHLTFDGPSLSVFDAKREIMLAKKMGKGLDFELALYDAQTNEEYRDDTFQIPRNASVIVRRVPASEQERNTGRVAARYLSGAAYTRRGVQVASGSGLPSASMTTSHTMQSSTAPLSAHSNHHQHHQHYQQQQQQQFQQDFHHQGPSTIAGETEEDRINAMMQQSTDQWQRESQQLAVTQSQKGLQFRPRPQFRPNMSIGGGGPGSVPRGGMADNRGLAAAYNNSYDVRTPPPGYVCHRCGHPGHYKANCPTIGNKAFDGIRMVKTTGIPKSFLKPVELAPVETDQDSLAETLQQPGAMITASGQIVRVMVNEKDFQEARTQTQAHRTTANLDQLYEAAIDAERSGSVPQGSLIPFHLQCPICQGLARDAVRSSCCQSIFCDSCVRERLHAQVRAADAETTPEMLCPSCNGPCSVDSLVPDAAIRQQVQRQLRNVSEFMREGVLPTAQDSSAEPTNMSGDVRPGGFRPYSSRGGFRGRPFMRGRGGFRPSYQTGYRPRPPYVPYGRRSSQDGSFVQPQQQEPQQFDGQQQQQYVRTQPRPYYQKQVYSSAPQQQQSFYDGAQPQQQYQNTRQQFQQRQTFTITGSEQQSQPFRQTFVQRGPSGYQQQEEYVVQPQQYQQREYRPRRNYQQPYDASQQYDNRRFEKRTYYQASQPSEDGSQSFGISSAGGYQKTRGQFNNYQSYEQEDRSRDRRYESSSYQRGRDSSSQGFSAAGSGSGRSSKQWNTHNDTAEAGTSRSSNNRFREERFPDEEPPSDHQHDEKPQMSPPQLYDSTDRFGGTPQVTGWERDGRSQSPPATAAAVASPPTSVQPTVSAEPASPAYSPNKTTSNTTSPVAASSSAKPAQSEGRLQSATGSVDENYLRSPSPLDMDI